MCVCALVVARDPQTTNLNIIRLIVSLSFDHTYAYGYAYTLRSLLLTNILTADIQSRTPTLSIFTYVIRGTSYSDSTPGYSDSLHVHLSHALTHSNYYGNAY